MATCDKDYKLFPQGGGVNVINAWPEINGGGTISGLAVASSSAILSIFTPYGTVTGTHYFREGETKTFYEKGYIFTVRVSAVWTMTYPAFIQVTSCWEKEEIVMDQPILQMMVANNEPYTTYDPITIIAQLKDSNYAPLAYKSINLICTSATSSRSVDTRSTDMSGEVQLNYIPQEGDIGTVSLQSKAQNIGDIYKDAISNTINITIVPKTTNSYINAHISSPSPYYSGEPINIEIELRTQDSQPIPNQSIKLEIFGEIPDINGTTDNDGIARITFTPPDSTIGTFSATAIYAGNIYYNQSSSDTLYIPIEAKPIVKSDTLSGLKLNTPGPHIGGQPLEFVLSLVTPQFQPIPNKPIELVIIGHEIILGTTNVNGVVLLSYTPPEDTVGILNTKAQFRGDEEYNLSTSKELLIELETTQPIFQLTVDATQIPEDRDIELVLMNVQELGQWPTTGENFYVHMMANFKKPVTGPVDKVTFNSNEFTNPPLEQYENDGFAIYMQEVGSTTSSIVGESQTLIAKLENNKNYTVSGLIPPGSITKGICELLGLEGTECTTFVSTLYIDLLVPYSDLSIIVNGYDPYTGETREPEWWNYAFTALYLLPFAKFGTTAISEGGAMLIKAIRNAPGFKTFLQSTDGMVNLLGKINTDSAAITHLTDLLNKGQIDEAIDYIKDSQMDDLAYDALRSQFKRITGFTDDKIENLFDAIRVTGTIPESTKLLISKLFTQATLTTDELAELINILETDASARTLLTTYNKSQIDDLTIRLIESGNSNIIVEILMKYSTVDNSILSETILKKALVLHEYNLRLADEQLLLHVIQNAPDELLKVLNTIDTTTYNALISNIHLLSATRLQLDKSIDLIRYANYEDLIRPILSDIMTNPSTIITDEKYHALLNMFDFESDITRLFFNDYDLTKIMDTIFTLKDSPNVTTKLTGELLETTLSNLLEPQASILFLLNSLVRNDALFDNSFPYFKQLLNNHPDLAYEVINDLPMSTWDDLTFQLIVHGRGYILEVMEKFRFLDNAIASNALVKRLISISDDTATTVPLFSLERDGRIFEIVKNTAPFKRLIKELDDTTYQKIIAKLTDQGYTDIVDILKSLRIAEELFSLTNLLDKVIIQKGLASVDEVAELTKIARDDPIQYIDTLARYTTAQKVEAGERLLLSNADDVANLKLGHLLKESTVLQDKLGPEYIIQIIPGIIDSAEKAASLGPSVIKNALINLSKLTATTGQVVDITTPLFAYSDDVKYRHLVVLRKFFSRWTDAPNTTFREALDAAVLIIKTQWKISSPAKRIAIALQLVAEIGMPTLFVGWFAWEIYQFQHFGKIMEDKVNGIESGATTFGIGSRISAIGTIWFNLDRECKAGNTTYLKSSIPQYIEAKEELERYTAENLNQIIQEQELPVVEAALKNFELELVRFQKCAGIYIETPVPTTGIMTGVKVTNIIDGDSFDAIWTDPNGNTHEFEARLIGINAPEFGGQDYRLNCSAISGTIIPIIATKEIYANARINLIPLLNNPVTLQIDMNDQTDSYGRYLTSVTVEKINYNVLQIRKGLACASYDYTENSVRTEILPDILAAQELAIHEKLGIWGLSPTGEYGYIDIRTQPTDAEKYINGIYMGRTNKAYAVIPNEQNTVKVSKTEYESVTKENIIAPAGITIPLSIILPEIGEYIGPVGIIDFTVHNPPATQIWEGDTPIGTTSSNVLLNKEFSVGTHTFTFSKYGYTSESITIEVKENIRTPISVTLEEIGIIVGPTGIVDFTVTQPTATQIWEGATLIGTTISNVLLNKEFTLGEHTFTFSKYGYISQSTTVNVAEENIRYPIIVTLEEEGAIQGPTGHVDFTVTEPTATQIWEDNTLIGTTSSNVLLNVEFPAGDHIFRFSKYGYISKETTVNVPKNDRAQVTIALDKTGDIVGPIGHVDFTTEPTAVQIWIEQTLVGITSSNQLLDQEFAVGEYLIDFKKYGYEEVTKTFTVIENERTAVEATLIPIEDEYDDPGDWYIQLPGSSEYTYSGYSSGTSTGSSGAQISTVPYTHERPFSSTKPENNWELFKEPINITILTTGKSVPNQKQIISDTERFIKKHSGLKIDFDIIKHPEIEPEINDEGCELIALPSHLDKIIDKSKFPKDKNYQLIYILWNTNKSTCTIPQETPIKWENTLVQNIPINNSDPSFYGKSTSAEDKKLNIKYFGSLEMIRQIQQAIHTMYNSTKPSTAKQLPKLYIEIEDPKTKTVTIEKPDATKIIEWFNEMKEQIPFDPQEVS